MNRKDLLKTAAATAAALVLSALWSTAAQAQVAPAAPAGLAGEMVLTTRRPASFAQAQAAEVPNVTFVDLQPKGRLPEVLAAADVHVVPLRAGLAKASVPSKLYSILAAARPLVASVDPGTEVANTVERAGAGLSVPPGDAEALTKALRQLIEQSEDARAMGEAGRAFVEGWPSPAEISARYAELFDSLVRRR